MNTSTKLISMLFASSLIVACGGSSNDDTTDPVDPTPTPVNSTGQASITGAAQVGETLTASVTDTNGLSGSTITYQWRNAGVDITGATSSTYTITSAEEGDTLSVLVTYTDDDGFSESIESAATSAITPPPATNTSGTVTISGSTQVGQTLNATVSDSNGTSNSTITYQWLANGSAISGATTGSLALTDSQLGQTISVEVSYVDDDGFFEDLTSQATQAIAAAPTAVEGGGNFTRGTVGDNDSVPAVTCDTVFTSTSQLEDTATREMTPGTTLCLADGTYSGLELDFGGTGTADALITVAAENPGEVIVNGEVGVRMSGDYVVLQGFIFMDGESASSDFLQTRGGNNEFCHNCRVTEIAVINLDENDPDSRGRWIHIYGTHNRVDHSWFSGKRTGAPLLAVNREIPNDGGLDDVAENFHMIDHNYFGDRPPTDGKAYASTSDNEFEGVQIGTSDAHDRNSSTTVAHNYFERIDGEAEVISNKSSNNTIFNNTLRDSYGSITNRHGNTTTISNNFVIGDGHPFSGGLRIVDDSHTVVNNYIEGARFLNTRFHGGIVLHNTDGSTTNGYQVFENVLVANNTVVDSVNSLNVNGGNRNTEPTDVRFVNNIIDNAVGKIIRTEGEGMPADSIYAGNFVEGLTFSDDDSLTSFSGFTQTTIELQDDVLGIARPTAASEALIAANNSADLSPFTSPTEDIDGHTRSDISTSGADEISDDAVVYGILNANDVGPISFRPPITEAIIRRVDVTNGGFDAGEQGWVFEGSAEVTDDPDQIFARGASAQVADVSDRISQTVTVDTNTNYALTAFTRGPVSLGADIDGTEETGDFNNSEYRLSQFEFNSGNATQVTLFGTLDGFVENNVDIEEANFSNFDSSASDDNPWIILEGSAIPGGGQVQRSGNSASGADGSARFRYNDETESGSPMMSQILSDIAPSTDYELSLFVLADDSVTGTVAITDTDSGVEITSKLLDFAALVAADAPRADDSFREDTLSFNSGSSSSITLSITYTANTIIPDGRGDREDTDLRIDDITITFLGAPNDGDEGLIDEMRLVSFPSN